MKPKSAPPISPRPESPSFSAILKESSNRTPKAATSFSTRRLPTSISQMIRGIALRFSKDHGATRTATPETGHFTRSRHGASPNRRLPILTAAAGIQRARHFPSLSRVGRGIDVKRVEAHKKTERGVREPSCMCQTRPDPEVVLTVNKRPLWLYMPLRELIQNSSLEELSNAEQKGKPLWKKT